MSTVTLTDRERDLLAEACRFAANRIAVNVLRSFPADRPGLRRDEADLLALAKKVGTA